jgi:hypothetical protein
MYTELVKTYLISKPIYQQVKLQAAFSEHIEIVFAEHEECLCYLINSKTFDNL